MRYLPHTKEDIERMLAVIGVDSLEHLFESIPAAHRFVDALPLPAALSEPELLDHLVRLGAKNKPATRENSQIVFAGAGLYHHHIPAAVDALSLRGEFATAYTPYQPELSQGTLMAIFEFQTMVAELYGTEFANASMYDGASATAEAMLMARRLTKRPSVAFSAGVHPEYQEVCRTYAAGIDAHGISSVILPLDENGNTDLQKAPELLPDNLACIIVQTPNFFGIVEDVAPLAELAHRKGALLVAVNTEPLACALMQPPGQRGADIVAGDGSSLATTPTLGGPGVGLFGASGKKALRAMPGRLAGQTVDADGRPGYVLTLSTREQHIRRDKATSNICTNHGLYALRFAIHLSLLGKRGLRELAQQNLAKAHYAKEAIAALDGFSLRYRGPIFNELAVRCPADAQTIVEKAAALGVMPGVALGRFDDAMRDTLLLAVTEMHTKDDIERLAAALARVAKEAAQ
jgi:glycine dehydrogenase subunit 1